MAFSTGTGELILSDSFTIEQVKDCWLGLKGIGLHELRLLNLKNLQHIDLAGLQVIMLVLKEMPDIQVILPTNMNSLKLLGFIGVKEGKGQCL